MVRVPFAFAITAVAAMVASILFYAFPATHAGTNPEPNGIASAATVNVTSSPPGPKEAKAAGAVARRDWAALSPSQQDVLAPLASEWEKMGPAKRKQWLKTANRFPSMTAAARQRAQKRMYEWVKLSPQQRHHARQAYVRAKTLNREEKSALWQDYQQLSENEKLRLGASRADKNPVATLAPPQSGVIPVPPIQSVRAQIMERSLRPQAANTGFDNATEILCRENGERPDTPSEHAEPFHPAS
jgi:hypothetical protein